MSSGEVTSRPYGGEADLSLITGFLADVASFSPPQSYLHPGDAVWSMYQTTVFDPTREVRLGEDASELLGFAWLEEPDGVVMQVHPRLRGSGMLEDEMLGWAAGQSRAEYGERAGDGEGEWSERVETHREVWHPSRVTPSC